MTGKQDFMREGQWGLEKGSLSPWNAAENPTLVPSPVGPWLEKQVVIISIFTRAVLFHRPILSCLVGFPQAQGSWHGGSAALS